MKKLISHIPITVSYFFVLLFCYAAFSKILDFENFQVQIGQSPLLSAYAGFISYATITLELIVGLLLIFERTRLWGLYSSTALMTSFTVYIIIILNFSEFVPCSCGGILEKLGWTEHLIFNLICVILGVVSVLFSKKSHNNRLTAILLVSSNIFSCMIIIMLSITSEHIIKKDNNFTRSFLPHRITEDQRIDLGSDQYYIAGLDDQFIYLGSTQYPQKMLWTDIQTGKIDSLTIKPESLNFTFKKLSLQVKGCFYYLSDGTVPVIFRGSLGNPKAKIISYRDAYFSQIEPLDSIRFAIRTHDNRRQQLTLGLLDLQKEKKVSLNYQLLTKQTDGVFDSDGKLISVNGSSKLAYLYSYRNRFMIIDSRVQSKREFKTIDTVNNASVKSKSLSTGQHKMFAPPLVVNQDIAVYKNTAMIHSKLKAINEPNNTFKNSKVFDIYNTENSEYIGSFYIYHEAKKRLTDFVITDRYLYALIGNELIRYRYQITLEKNIKTGEAENLIQE